MNNFQLGANALTGLIELLGGVIGGYVGTDLTKIIPNLMCFAGGSMLYVTIIELLQQLNNNSIKKIFNIQFIYGFIFILFLNLIS